MSDWMSKHKDTLKDYAYAIMSAGSPSYVGGGDRNIIQITNSILNKDKIAANRLDNIIQNSQASNYARDLHSLYIYGNDAEQFKEAPELKDLGVDYVQYLRSVGKDPDRIRTYKGRFGNEDFPVFLPESIKPAVIEYINSSHNRTFPVTIGGYWSKQDDVANHLRRFTSVKGEPFMVNSDLWDFTPSEYSKSWGASQWKAKLLDRVGTPFILKNMVPVRFVPDEEFYYDRERPNRYGAKPTKYQYQSLENHNNRTLQNLYDRQLQSNPNHYTELYKEFGILPELIVKPKK